MGFGFEGDIKVNIACEIQELRERLALSVARIRIVVRDEQEESVEAHGEYVTQ